MSSDSERLPKPTKRQRMILSDSDNSDNLFVNANHRKRRICRVMSEDETSDDDSDIPQRSVQKRKNHKLISEDESSYDSSSSNNGARNNFVGGSTSDEWQSDWESMEESGCETADKNSNSKCKKSPKKSPEKDQRMNTTCDSENSDGESEKCPICLLPFRNQEVANPASCEHCFCLDCIIEWSKNVNTCPVDRQSFTVINVRTKIGGKIVRYVPIETKSLTEEVVQEDPTFCEVCQRCDREDRMLLCDGCDSGYHLECLDPPMDEVPLEEHWFCPECSRNTQNDAEDIDIDLDEVPDLMEEARRLGLSYGRTRASLVAQGLFAVADSPGGGRSRNLVPRTRQTERVRANVRASRSRRAVAADPHDAGSRGRERASAQPSTSSGFDSISENSRGRSPIPGPSGASSSRRATSSALARRRRPRKQRRKQLRKMKRRRAKDLHEVRITEINENGELEEMVTYVRSASGAGAPAPGRRKKKRKIVNQRFNKFQF